MLDKFDKTIQPNIIKVIDRIDKKKEIFTNKFNKNSMIQPQKKKSGQMSVDSEVDKLSDHHSFIGPDIME